jgi:hypothetical protein
MWEISHAGLEAEVGWHPSAVDINIAAASIRRSVWASLSATIQLGKQPGHVDAAMSFWLLCVARDEAN